jgi:hypothetical protein
VAARKTISIETLKTKVNDMILNTPDDDKCGRELLSVLLENILLENKNYLGFRYLSKEDMQHSKNGTSVGIKRYADPFATNPISFDDTDNTRVYYF